MNEQDRKKFKSFLSISSPMSDMVDEEIEKTLERLVDGLSGSILSLHKKKLGLEGKNLKKDEYILLLEELKKSIEKFAGKKIAEEIYREMLEYVEKYGG